MNEFKNQLMLIQDDLNAHRRPRDKILYESVQNRLEQSLQQYKKELSNICIALQAHNEKYTEKIIFNEGSVKK